MTDLKPYLGRTFTIFCKLHTSSDGHSGGVLKYPASLVAESDQLVNDYDELLGEEVSCDKEDARSLGLLMQFVTELLAVNGKKITVDELHEMRETMARSVLSLNLQRPNAND